MSDPLQGQPPYRMSQDEVVAALATDPQAGLSLEEARGRLERHGRNELTAERPVPGLAQVPRPVPGRARHPASDNEPQICQVSRCPCRHCETLP